MSKKKVLFQNGKIPSSINCQQLKRFYKDLWKKIIPKVILDVFLMLIKIKTILIETLYRHQMIFSKFRTSNKIHYIFYKRNFNKLWAKSTIHNWKSIPLLWENLSQNCLKINIFQNLSPQLKPRLLSKAECKTRKITLLPMEYYGSLINSSILSSKSHVFIYLNVDYIPELVEKLNEGFGFDV